MILNRIFNILCFFGLFGMAWGLDVSAKKVQPISLKTNISSSVKIQKTQTRTPLNTELDKLNRNFNPKDHTRFGWSKYYHLHETSELPPYVSAKYMDKDTLVVFDVDGVLLHTTDRVFQNWSSQWESRILPSKVDDFWSLISRGPVDPKMPGVVKEFNRKRIPIMALTSHDTGPRGRFRSMENKRILELRKAGYDLSPFWKGVSPKTFCASLFSTLGLNSLHKWRYNGATPAVFKEGVLCTGCNPKGEVLGKFLDTLDWKPKRILFIDDMLCFHFSMAELADARKIESLGILYTKVATDAKLAGWTPMEDKDEDRDIFRIDHFNKTDKWLSEGEAEKILAKAAGKKQKLSTPCAEGGK